MKTKCPDCCHPELFDSRACGCCEGVEISTPQPTANRPGLSQLRYRIGTHAHFLESMQARLSNQIFSALSGLTTRDGNDPSMALLDAWAVVGDVLTFYQERIANEGYLMTATERRSILELGRLVGYRLQPGVAASVFLAYTLDEKMPEEVVIPTGSRVQSIPGPGELPQAFETSEDLKARSKWNNLKPRLTRPQTVDSIVDGSEGSSILGPRIYLKGISTDLKTNDPILIDFQGDGHPVFFRVKQTIADADADRTLVSLIDPAAVSTSDDSTEEEISTEPPDSLQLNIIKALTQSPSLQPRNTLHLKRALSEQFKSKAETGYTAVKRFAPVLGDTLSTAAANAIVTADSTIKVYALRQTASLLGHNHPGIPNYEKDLDTEMIKVKDYTLPKLKQVWPSELVGDNKLSGIAVEPADDTIIEGGWIVIDRPALENPDVQARKISIHDIETADLASHAAFGISAKANILKIDKPWLDDLTAADRKTILANNLLLKKTTVYMTSEALELAEEPIETVLKGGQADDPLELDGFYEGLESGRWVIVSGERDIAGTSGVRFSELAMLSSVIQDYKPEQVEQGSGSENEEPEPTYADEKTHTFIKLAEKFEYEFKRDTITIYGNVVKATHGETREEVLGSGDGSKALQSFALKQFPLTHVSASNPRGVDSTLKLVVNDLQWHEIDSLVGLLPTDRKFVTQTDNEDKTTVTFGNGDRGARLPTGVENIRAIYRNGIGRPGNVAAEQISLLVSKPLGVKEVINPLRASGGADRESRDRARKNTPLAVKALDRLVSVQDYEDFARVYAGIGKAKAVELTDRRRQIVHVTIAGADDIPIDENSDLFLNLRQALHEFGDPFQPITLAVRELMMIVISADVRILPDYQWETVAANVRERLLAAFGLESRELGQDVLLSEVISVMQAVKGVAFVDVNTFGGIPEKITDNGARRLLAPDEVTEAVDCISTRWSRDDLEAWCAAQSAEEECHKYFACKKFGDFGTPTSVRQRLRVNLAGREDDVLRPAQLAFLTPDLPETLILNRLE